MIKVKVAEDQAGARLDVFLSNQLDILSRSSIQKLIDDGKVTVDKKVEKSKYKVRENDSVEVDYDPIKAEEIPKIDLPILYEDDDCLVVNKSAGLLTHSKGAFNPEATVATFIAPKLQGQSGDRAGIVHRLDRATSGVIICAKTPEALGWLQKQFSQRKVKKIYFAVVSGHLEPKHAVIEMPIERHPRAPKTFRVGAQGKPAITEYKLIESSDRFDLLELKPTTGRTHQLRVHMKQVGHPIVGDSVYGDTVAERMFLHAGSLEITLPNRQRKVFEVPLPIEFKELLEKIS